MNEATRAPRLDEVVPQAQDHTNDTTTTILDNGHPLVLRVGPERELRIRALAAGTLEVTEAAPSEVPATTAEYVLANPQGPMSLGQQPDPAWMDFRAPEESSEVPDLEKELVGEVCRAVHHRTAQMCVLHFTDGRKVILGASDGAYLAYSVVTPE